MSIITLKPDALVLPDFDFATVAPFMERTEDLKTLMGYSGFNGYGSWTYGGTMGMGYRLKGDNLDAGFLSGWDTSTPAKLDAKTAAIASWWNRIVPWFSACPATANTCTNAAVRITGAQCYVLSNVTGLWSRVGGYTQQNVNSSIQYQLLGGSTAYVSDGASTGVFSDSINIPAFPFCPNGADWSAADGTTTKYRIIRTGTMSATIDAQTVGGIFTCFDSQLVSTNGQPLNGVVDFLIQCGADAYINNDNLGIGTLLGAPYVPAIGLSAFMKINSDGTRRRHYFGTFLGTNTYQTATSEYMVNGGVSALTSAQFQANMPRR